MAKKDNDPIKFLRKQGYSENQIIKFRGMINDSYGDFTMENLSKMMHRGDNSYYFNASDREAIREIVPPTITDASPERTQAIQDAATNLLKDTNHIMAGSYTGEQTRPAQAGYGVGNISLGDDQSRGGGSGRGRSGGSNITNTGQYFDANGNINEEYLRMQDQYDLDLLKQQRDSLANMKADPMDESYAPDNQMRFGENLWDAGRAALGFAGTQEEVPTYTPSAAMSEYISDARRLKDVGLTAEEEELREQYADRGYASDVANIRRLSGGSAATALANLGSASDRYYNQMAGIAADDEATRRMNRAQFGQAAGQAENIKRLQHAEERELAMMNKQAGGDLMNDALTNIKERGDFEKYYGKGSQHYEMMKEQTLGSRAERKYREDANDLLRQSMMDKYDRDILDLEYRLNGAGNYRPEQVDNRGGGTDYRDDKDVKLLEDVYQGEGIGMEKGSRFKGDVVYRTDGVKTDNDVFQVASKITDPKKATQYILENNPHEKAVKDFYNSSDYDKYSDASNKKLEELRKKSQEWEDMMINRISSKK